MSIKQFLKPDSKKISITLILFSLGSIILWYTSYSSSLTGECYPCGDCGVSIGFPLSFYVSHPLGICETIINLPYLIIDVILLYLISCVIMKVYNRIKKKEEVYYYGNVKLQ